MSGRSRRVSALRRLARAALGVSAVGMLTVVAPAVAHAHDDIESSVPADRSVIDEPISTASVDFGEVIGDSVQLFLVYDPGDGSTIDIGGETVKTGDTTARLDFEEISAEGTYFLRFLAPVPSDGHVLSGAISFSWGTPTAVDGGNDDVLTSSPAMRERLDEPISSAEIEFNVEIDDDIELQLVYDQGDGENFDELGGTTTKLSPRRARIDFDGLPKTGTYFIQYDGTATANGEEVRGATSFVWGEPSGASSSFPVIPFAATAAVILAIGAWFTVRRAKRADVADDGELEPDAELTPA